MTTLSCVSRDGIAPYLIIQLHSNMNVTFLVYKSWETIGNRNDCDSFPFEPRYQVPQTYRLGEKHLTTNSQDTCLYSRFSPSFYLCSAHYASQMSHPPLLRIEFNGDWDNEISSPVFGPAFRRHSDLHYYTMLYGRGESSCTSYLIRDSHRYDPMVSM